MKVDAITVLVRILVDTNAVADQISADRAAYVAKPMTRERAEAMCGPGERVGYVWQVTTRHDLMGPEFATREAAEACAAALNANRVSTHAHQVEHHLLAPWSEPILVFVTEPRLWIYHSYDNDGKS